jgi:glycosyltransferase involved in cell wall biosynthesis
MEALPKIAIVLPVHSEAANIAPMAARLGELMQSLADWQIVFVDDGSTDDSLARIKRLATADRRIRYVALVRNFGHQLALRAGLHHAQGDAVIVMDSDFEHPPELVPKLIAEWQRGAKVVLTRRVSGRAQASLFKRWTSRLFYALFDAVSDVRIEPGSPDFMLLDRAAVEAVGKFESHDLFLRGLVRWLGFPSASVSFTPGLRHAGKSKYSVRRMIDFAMMGIVAHSIKPLRIAIYLSFVFALLGSLLFVYSLVSFFWVDRTVAGWTSIMSAIAILGAGQFLVLGIIGEYVGRVLREVRRWPIYVVAETEAALATRSTVTPIGADIAATGSDRMAGGRALRDA